MRLREWWMRGARWSASASRARRRQRWCDIPSAVELLEDRLVLSGFPQPDFHLTDVNETSTSTGQAVSPRDYLEEVSAWYFAHAT